MSNDESIKKKRRFDWWYFFVFVFVFLQLCFYIIPQFRPGIAGAILWYFGIDTIIWLIIGFALLVSVLVWGLFNKTIWNRKRIAACVLIMALAISPMAFRVYPSSYDDSPSSVHFRLPLDGSVTIAWGGATPKVNYHVMAPDQRWAYDFVVTKEGKTHKGQGEACEDFYCYGMPILAPADGKVHAVVDGDPDMPIGVLGGGSHPGGNHVILEVASSEYLFICHMQPRSITVKAGDAVQVGQIIGAVGNSGNTSEPHIHVHLQDTPISYIAEGIPFYYYHYRVDGELVECGIPTGGVAGGKWGGQVVEHVGEQTDG